MGAGSRSQELHDGIIFNFFGIPSEKNDRSVWHLEASFLMDKSSHKHFCSWLFGALNVKSKLTVYSHVYITADCYVRCYQSIKASFYFAL